MRQPIVVVLGHVDHGKTALLDYIRKTNVQAKEAGGITQHIGATEIPSEYICKFCKPTLEKLGIKVDVPELLFVDTPGHAAFSNLRKRGGSVADLAILVIDIKSGVKPQTLESIEILKHFKVPFIIAANKLDNIDGYKSRETSFIENIKQQNTEATTDLEMRTYAIVSKLAEQGFDAERIDRIDDFAKQICIIPTSASTGEGVVDMLAILAGLSQRYLKNKLETTNKTKGNVLEVKQEKGLGTTIDVIIYDGELKDGDTIVLAGRDEPIVTKIRALLKPEPLKEIRTEKKFKRVKKVKAASGVKISAPNLEGVVPGGTILVAKPDEVLDAVEAIRKEMEAIEFSTDKMGVIVKADALGTLEAIVNLIKEKGITVRKADIGDITRKDIMEASEVGADNRFLGVILGFNVKHKEEGLAKEKGVTVFSGEIIYRIIEDYEEWVELEKQKIREEELGKLVRSAKFQILPNFVFRASKPAVVGVEVLGGVLKNHIKLMKEDGTEVGKVKQLEIQGESVKEAKRGGKLAVSISGPTVGRQIDEGDILYTSMHEANYRGLKKFLDLMDEDERDVLEEIIIIKRKGRKNWGMLEV
ncbi:MAG: translation initiation factor IF-2 [Candidatus Altiarchaeota archaeon]|nr:translation initiation factor IF-2 [Candidatus Altiarchaeota archaeon]